MIILINKKTLMIVSTVVVLFLVFFSIVSSRESKVVSVANDVSDICIAIDAGHGGEDPGAIGRTTDVLEKDLNLDIALRLGKSLEDDGYKVIYTRTEDKLSYGEGANTMLQKRSNDLSMRKSILNGDEVDLGISIHMNSFGQTQYRGLQVFYPRKDENSKMFAEIVQDNAKKIVNYDNNRKALVDSRDTLLLKNNTNPIVFVECGFLSNPEDERLLNTEEYRELISRCIKKSIEQYFKGIN